MYKILKTPIISAICVLFLGSCQGHPSVLNPKGVVTFLERKLLFDAAALMLIIVLTVIIMSFVFVYHYRADNHNAEYKPEWCHSVFLESIWWGVPALVVLILSIMTWNYTHKLDPYRRLNYPGEVINIKVIALPWKWLFIYPDNNLGSVNHLVLPNLRQVEFHLTSDNVPMSSFFIPQLGSQIYTMAGMRTRLHIIPSYAGTYEGFNAQYNGDGFADMRFKVDVVDYADYKKWLSSHQNAGKKLSNSNYSDLRSHSINHSVEYYSLVPGNLFNNIISSYSSSSHPQWDSKEKSHV